MLLRAAVPFGSDQWGSMRREVSSMSLLVTRELLAVAALVVAVIAVMLLLALTQSRNGARADARGQNPPPRRRTPKS
jgi:hypothetical protein